MVELYSKKKIKYNESDVEHFIDLGFDEDFAQIMSARGITQENEREYLDKEYFSFIDPFLMKNMSSAVDMIKNAMNQQQKILIYGDYDADGLTASAILKLFFLHNDVDADVLIPTRADGYGLHFDLVKERFEKRPFDLLITVDCGISNKEEISEIVAKLPVSVLVTDHHELPETLPDCVCINCKMDYPCKVLSGAGVALKLVQALSGTETLFHYTDLAAVGTVADMMPLIGENRMIVRHGLRHFNHRGLKKLADATKCELPLSANSLAMKICPKINSAGRVGDPMSALRLLLMDQKATNEAVEQLINCNSHRQKILEVVLLEAEKQITELDISAAKMLFLKGENWPHGILGIAANKFKEIYGIPCAFLTKEGENFVGSARSSDNLNLFELFSGVSDLLVKFGGHSGSVGFTVLEKNYDELVLKINEILSQSAFNSNKKILYDLEFNPKWLNASYFEKLDILEPILPNEKLLFFAKDYSKTASTFGNGHIRFILGSGLEIKAFNNYSQYLLPLKNQAECNVVFGLEKDKYNNKICGAAVHLSFENSLHFDSLYAVNILCRMTNSLGTRKYIDKEEISGLLKQDNAIVLFDDYCSFDKASKDFEFSEYTVDFFSKRNNSNKGIIISPSMDFDYCSYKNVIAFCNYEDFFEVDYGKSTKYASLHLPIPSFLSKIYLDRGICGQVFLALKNERRTPNLWEISKRLSATISQQQFVAAIKVFEELNLVSNLSDLRILSSAQKLNLDDSKFFRFFNNNNRDEL